jgi:hypothetical protein
MTKIQLTFDDREDVFLEDRIVRFAYRSKLGVGKTKKNPKSGKSSLALFAIDKSDIKEFKKRISRSRNLSSEEIGIEIMR